MQALDRKPAAPCTPARPCRPRSAPAAPRRKPPVPGRELLAAAGRRGLALRAQARVGAAADPAERAADGLAERALASGPARAGRCSCGGVAGPDGECAGCRTRRLRRQAPTALVEQTIGTPGRPLDAATRGFFEPRLGSDLSHVRVHSGDRAAESAASLDARAFALGSEVVFGAGEYAPGTPGGRRLLAHELAHVVQEGNRHPVIRRRVVTSRVSCRNTGLHGGVPGGVIAGADAVATITAADTRAIELALRAEARLFVQRVTHGLPTYTPDPVVDTALLTRFGLSLATPAHHATIEIIERELASVRRYLESGLINYICRDPACAGEWAFIFAGETRTLRLCNPFWNAGSVNQQGATLLHEAMHLWWDQINDQGHRPLHNAHCFEQLALDLSGASADILPQFAGSCVV